MKNKIQILLLTAALSGALSAQATPLSNANNSDFYYEIGGASSISEPLNANVKTQTLSAAAEFGLGYSCGKFNPTLALSNILNGLSSAGNSLINGAVGAVTSAIGSLPALVMQRIDPGLYDLFQNALIRAEATLALANKTCEQYEQDIRNGKNPYEEWTKLSKVIDWKVQMGTGGPGSSKVDVVQAKKNVEKDNGANGTPWLGGKRAGGSKPGQQPIRVTQDIVKAGYNITLNRAADKNTPPKFPKGATVPRLAEVFKQPAEASQWAVRVLGDTFIQLYDNKTPKTVPGVGLLPGINDETQKIGKSLQALVAGKTKPTIKNLEAVSSNATLINKEVIRAIQSMAPGEQVIAINKLASESAMAKELEKALMTRRLLLTGSKEPNIKLSPVDEHIRELVSQLDRSINDILFERRVRKELTSDTARTLLSIRNATINQDRSAHSEPASFEEKLITEDGVKK